MKAPGVAALHLNAAMMRLIMLVTLVGGLSLPVLSLSGSFSAPRTPYRLAAHNRAQRHNPYMQIQLNPTVKAFSAALLDAYNTKSSGTVRQWGVEQQPVRHHVKLLL
jgi:hypothetical protein